MKPLFIPVIAAAFLCRSHMCLAQLSNKPAKEVSIPLANHLDTSYNEFSGLARWNNKLLLIVQHAEALGDLLYAIDLTSVDSVVDNEVPSVSHFTKVHLNGLEKMVDSIDPLHKFYGGFEAAVVVGNSLFLTVETDKDTCYIVKGDLRQSADSIVVDLVKKYPLLKPHPNIANAGFESIAYLPRIGRLVSFFENNYLRGPTVFAVDTALTKTDTLYFPDAPLLRITDIAALNDGVLVGLNHYYNDYHKSHSEFDYYVGNDLVKAVGQMHGKNPMDSSFTSVIVMRLKGKQLYWKEKKFISFSADNWEGILPYRNGVLMVIDGVPPGTRCRLAYFKL